MNLSHLEISMTVVVWQIKYIPPFCLVKLKLSNFYIPVFYLMLEIYNILVVNVGLLKQVSRYFFQGTPSGRMILGIKGISFNRDEFFMKCRNLEYHSFSLVSAVVSLKLVLGMNVYSLSLIWKKLGHFGHRLLLIKKIWSIPIFRKK